MTSQTTGTVGSQIRQAREAAGFSQDSLAAALGTTRQIIIGWEKDRHVPGAHYKRRLSEVLGHDVSSNGDGPADEEGD